MPKKDAVVKDSPQLRKHKAEAKNEFARLFPSLVLLLKAHNVAKVTVEYSGSGDDGNINTITYLDADGKGIRFPTDSADWDPYKASTGVRMDLDERIQKVVDARMENANDISDWCNGEGGGGELTLDVDKGTLKAKHYYNVTYQKSANYSGWGKTHGENS